MSVFDQTQSSAARSCNDKSGVGAIEYTFLIALIANVAALRDVLLAENLSTFFNDTSVVLTNITAVLSGSLPQIA